MGRAVKDVGFTEKGGNQEELGGRGWGTEVQAGNRVPWPIGV